MRRLRVWFVSYGFCFAVSLRRCSERTPQGRGEVCCRFVDLPARAEPPFSRGICPTGLESAWKLGCFKRATLAQRQRPPLLHLWVVGGGSARESLHGFGGPGS